MNENSLLREIGRSFIVSSFVPAALFISIAALIFWDFCPFFLKIRMPTAETLFAGGWLLIAMVIFWTGFGLYSSWNWTVALYEGYFFPFWFSEWKKKLLFEKKERRVIWIKKFYDKQNWLKNLDDEQKGKELQSLAFKEIYADLQTKAMEEYQRLELIYPKEKYQFMPTRLGNILRASERYSWDRYRVEGITFFSRLVHLLPSAFAAQLEEQNNKFIFLLNSTFLSLVIGMLCFLILLIRLPCHFLNDTILKQGMPIYTTFACTEGPAKNFFQSGFTNLNEWNYAFIGTGFFLASWALYEITLIAANAYGRLIRASYDLYRFDLLKKYCVALPDSLESEWNTWRKLSQFIISGKDLGEIELGYSHSKEPEESRKAVTLSVQPLQIDVQMKKKRRLLNLFGD